MKTRKEKNLLQILLSHIRITFFTNAIHCHVSSMKIILLNWVDTNINGLQNGSTAIELNTIFYIKLRFFEVSVHTVISFAMIILICVALVCIIFASIFIFIIRVASKCIYWLLFKRHEHESSLNLYSQENLDNIKWHVEEREARRVQYAIDELLPKVTYGDNEFKILESDVCVVFLNGYMDSEWFRILPSCKHMFHSRCIDRWLKCNLTCPIFHQCISLYEMQLTISTKSMSKEKIRFLTLILLCYIITLGLDECCMYCT